MAANDIGFLSCILIFSYLALRAHIPRTLSILCVLFGASGLICSMPHFLFGAAADVTGDTKNDTMSSSAKTVTSFGQLCLLDGNRFISATDCEETEQSDETAGAISGRAHSQAALVLIVIGMMLQGICKSPRWPYVIFYVDGNIGDKTKTGFYLGVVVALAIFGPVLAFILGGVFTKMYVTLEPTTLTPTHPRWIGAWWLGFLVFGIMSMMIGVPLVWFPRWMKGKAPEVKKPTDKHHGSTLEHHDKMKQALQQVKELPATMWRLLSNPIYISLLLSGCFVLFSVGGLQAFMPKYIENQFSLPAWRANLVIAVTSMITASFGTFVGGYLTRRFKMTPMESLKFTIVLQFFAVATAASGFFIKCPQPAIYNMPGGQGPTSSNASCFSSCLCDDNDYLPVCGSDGLTYFSPCHAGCVKAEDENTYTNCMCIPGGQAVAGACDYGCDMLYVFAVLQAVSALFSCMCIMPKMVTNIRCVTPRDKAFAMGCSSFMSSLLGWLLGPVIFGNMIDGVCSFWERTCDGRGTCLLYDNDVFRVRLFSYVVVARAGGFLCILVAYISARVTGRLDGTTSTHGAGEVDKKGFGMMD
nr:hypothetical protein BaRGS_018222 [Batillaria attramentaria]